MGMARSVADSYSLRVPSSSQQARLWGHSTGERTHTLVAPSLKDTVGDAVTRLIRLAISPGAISLGSFSPKSGVGLPVAASGAVCSEAEEAAAASTRHLRHRGGCEPACSRNALPVIVIVRGNLHRHTQHPVGLRDPSQPPMNHR
jgi:hypothetical protein